MARQIIVVGDTLAPHGGTVITGSDADIVDGRAVARKGDAIECKEHGPQTIAEGNDASMFGGNPVALHGHHATCGCTLVSFGTTISMP